MMSMKTKYGIKALTFICANREGGPISISTIAEAENIPRKFLEAILLTLKKGKILSSKKGKNGGYYMFKDPKDVLMTDIFRLINGPISMIPCASLNYYEKCADCPDEKLCGVNRLALEIRDSTLKVLRGKTLHQLTLEIQNR